LTEIEGWEITINDINDIRVYSNPSADDSDNDDLTDHMEYIFLSNPYSEDP